MNGNQLPLVTIGIPTFNRADGYLAQALNSALNQSYENIEVIISDNCSTDNTEELINKYDHSNLQYFRHDKNIGANENFNYCLKMANGRYFLLLHDDDFIDDDFVEVCIDSLRHSSDVGIIRTGTRIVDGSGNTLTRLPNDVEGYPITDFILAWLEDKTALFLCSTLFNTEKLKELGGFNSKTNLFQDVVAEFKLAAQFGRSDVRDVKASFRRHQDNRGSSAQADAWCEDSLYLLGVMCDLVEDKREFIRKEGLKYFCKKCYRKTAMIDSSVQRIATYLKMYKSFKYSYSPLEFLYERKAGSVKRLVRKLTSTSS